MHRKRHGKRAHTLMELLVVLTLLVLIAGMALPRFLVALSGMRLAEATDQLRQHINFARMRASSTGVRHFLEWDETTHELGVRPFRPEEMILQQQNAAAVPEGPEYVLQDALPEDVTIATWSVTPLGYDRGLGQGSIASYQDSPLSFYPEGYSDSLYVVLETESGTRRGFELVGFTGEIRELTADELRQR